MTVGMQILHNLAPLSPAFQPHLFLPSLPPSTQTCFLTCIPISAPARLTHLQFLGCHMHSSFQVFHLLPPQLRKPILHIRAWKASTHPSGCGSNITLSCSLHGLAVDSKLVQSPALGPHPMHTSKLRLLIPHSTFHFAYPCPHLP